MEGETVDLEMGNCLHFLDACAKIKNIYSRYGRYMIPVSRKIPILQSRIPRT